MVSTRGHPKQFPESPAPTSSSSRNDAASPTSPTSPTSALVTRRTSPTGWSHTPSNVILIWLCIAVPLVIWDCGYIFLRPHTFPGGALYFPFYVPYATYAKIDLVYSIGAWEKRYGFTGAQAAVNVLETAGNIAYMYIVYAYGKEAPFKGRGAAKKAAQQNFWQKLTRPRTIVGREAGWAVLLVFTASVSTLSKTLLYFLIQYYSGGADIKQNSFLTLFIYWILPNGPWIAFSTYMIYLYGSEILDGLAIASGDKKRN